MMKKFMHWLENTLAPAADKIMSNPVLDALAGAMKLSVPFILTGSVVYLYNVILTYVKWLPDINAIANYSFGIIGIIVSFYFGYSLLNNLKLDSASISGGILSVCLMIFVSVPVGKKVDSLSVFISNIGPTGMLVGLICGGFAGFIIWLWSKVHFLEESSIPSFVVNWLNVVIPNVLALGIVLILINGLKMDIFTIITEWIKPINNIAQTLPGFVLLCFIPAFFYTMGISPWLTYGVISVILLNGSAANMAAVKAGLTPTNITNYEAVYTCALVTMGGSCNTLVLNIMMLLSKSKQLKVLGRVCIVPSIFNINEPVVFSTVVFNPLLMIPGWITALIGPIIYYLVCQFGLLNLPIVSIVTGQIPAPFSTWLVTGDIRAFLWYVILFVIYWMIYYPFFKVYEKEKMQKESQQVNEEAKVA